MAPGIDDKENKIVKINKEDEIVKNVLLEEFK